MLTRDWTRSLGESGGSSVGKGGESDMENRRLQCCSPHLCQLRTDRLDPVSKYWIYWSHVGYLDLVNWCSLLPTDAWLSSIASMIVIGEKLSMDPRIDQPVCCGLRRVPPFSVAVDPFNSVVDSVKGCHIRGLPGEAYEWLTWTCAGSICVMCIRFSLYGVHRFESTCLSDMCNRLSCGNHHVDNLQELTKGLSLLCYSACLHLLVD
jgi:hypothetical protein